MLTVNISFLKHDIHKPSLIKHEYLFQSSLFTKIHVMKRIVIHKIIIIYETHLCICDKTCLTNQYVKYVTKFFSRKYESCDEFCF